MKTPFKLDDGIASKAALGLIVLEKDETLEPECAPLFAEEGVALYHSRICSDDAVTPETLGTMAEDLPRALALLPTARSLNVVAYACTSGATVIGQEKIAEMIRAVHPTAATTDPISAVIEACRHLGLRRLGMLTPYSEEVSMAMRMLLEKADLLVTQFASFEQTQDPVVARISPTSVQAAIRDINDDGDVDAVFVSCTNLRTLSVIGAAEADIGKPVISSNAALIWHMRRLAGLRPLVGGPGRLLRS